MADFGLLRNRVDALLSAPSVMPGARTTGATSARQRSGRPFSPFIDADLEEATQLTDRFMHLANEAGANRQRGFELVMQEAEREAMHRDPGLVRHALLLFMSHHPTGRTVRIPGLLQRSMPISAVAAAGPPRAFDLDSGSSPPEHQLDWFREDPLSNEHHEHWHLVYPRRGVPDGAGNRRLRNRHGELFFYMHQQMLARYDAERLAISGMGRIEPLANYRGAIPQGYDPGQLSVAGQTFVARPAETSLRDLAGGEVGPRPYSIYDHERRRDRFFEAAETAALRRGTELLPLTGHHGSDLLGKTNENTVASVSAPSPWSYYGNHHGLGHILIGAAVPGDQLGVITSTATAIRDPAFWRWHKHIDDMNFAYQETQPPHDFSDAPPVRLRKSGDESGDIIVVLKRHLHDFESSGFDFSAIALHAFGDTCGTDENQNWGRDVPSGEIRFRLGEGANDFYNSRVADGDADRSI